jgi:acetylornithine deacetylase/succinyl-diaminopimelate desuccinylase family protein
VTELTHLLTELIEIPSPNPPGDSRAIASFIARWLEGTGAKIEILHPPEKAEAQSVVATLGDGSAPVVMLHAHIDTVPVAETERSGWSSDPFQARLADGRIYGKGSVDDKAPLAAMMTAFQRLSKRPSHRGTLVLVAAAEEETGGQLGTRWMADAGHLPEADLVIVGEQTDNRIALAHKGVLRATVVTRGRSVHATRPDRGVNAITAMARIVLALDRYHQELQQRSHPLVGHPTCNVGVIEGGSTANAVPDRCSVRLDRRMIPREDPAEVERELAKVVGSVDVTPASAEVGEFLFSSWFDSELTTTWGQAFHEAVAAVTDAEPIGYLPGSDAKHLFDVARGDMVIFGPGSYQQAHASDEYVEIASLEACEAILNRFLDRSLAQEGSGA